MGFVISEASKDYIMKQRTYLKKPEDYYTSCMADLEGIEYYLPTEANHILDIGCGIGGMGVVLYRSYTARQMAIPRLWMFDKEDNAVLEYGYANTDRFYNQIEQTVHFLWDNNIPKTCVLSDLAKINQQMDLIISISSLGWHYPVKTYYADLIRLTKPESIVVIDIRDLTDDELCFINDFEVVHKVKIPKGTRYIYRRKL